MKYRREIDGLRAVAVVPVILFHAGLSLFSGGYVGVDVFFVISGYLITTIIIAERDEGRFSILRFYERRARRILPALFVVMGLCIPFAWMWMPPEPFDDFLRSTAFAALFISNVHFWENVGYFAVDAELRPLLHTWSLAVEEQYYLFFPLLLAGLGAFRRSKHIIAIAVLAALSLGLSEWGWRNYPDQNFFFTFSRMWELFAGSICAFIVFKRPVAPNGPAAALGLGMILYAVFFYDGAVPFPSIYALMPVVGTALVLLFAQQGTMVARLLSTKLPVAIGLVSYSAYLWHQPVFAFARLRSLHEPALWVMLGLALISFALAALSWRFIEQPFRAGPRKWLPGRPALFGASLAGIAAFVAFGLGGMQLGWANSRLDGRMTPFFQEVLDSTARGIPTVRCIESLDPDGNFCTIFKGREGGERIAVFGDSHARAILPAFQQYSEDSGARLVAGIKGGCPPLIGVYILNGNFPLGSCHDLAEAQARFVADNDISTVVLVSRWSLYTKGTYGREGDVFLVNDQPARQSGGRAAGRPIFAKALERTVSHYRDLGVRVIILEQVPQLLITPDEEIFAAMMLRGDSSAARQTLAEAGVPVAWHEDLQSFAREQFDKLEALDGVEVVSVSDAFRDGDMYRWFIDGRSAYSDLDHVSAYGARLLQSRMSEILSGK
ncbi:acyltransferase family protein [uncultured Roseovarius sp.]|uniref:acyltransferase family protein n=1 Tax=uncultured Roseovarius sp. TaxID=293344 RepID=UPI002595C2D8|nr:acyltransferase family protein [uncultured Roseovarius sp.]